MHEAVELLSRYLQIDTTNPPGNEDKGVAFFAEIFEKEKVDYKIYEAAPTRQSIKAVIPGSGQKGPLILLNHIDTVPVERDQWSFDPFSGAVEDGFIHGRGALDMKGQGIMELLALLDIKRKGLTPCRDIIFLAVADEEAGGKYGVKFLLDNHADDFEADIVFNEGGYGINDLMPDRPVVMVSTAEKGIIWVKLTRTGPPGHGSIPHGQNALEKMVQAINRLLDRENPLIITDVTAEYFKQMGAGWDFLKPYLDNNDRDTLVQVLTESGMAEIPQISATLRNTVSVTMMTAGTKANVIPSRVETELDIRILPGVDPDEFVDELKQQLADDDIGVQITTKHRATESPMDSSSCSLIKKVISKHFPDALVVPSLLMAVSDSRFLRERGINCYGVCPALIQMDDVQRIHGHDEKISVENMIKGTEVYSDIVKRLCVV